MQPYYEKFRQKGGSKEKRLYGLDRICKKKKIYMKYAPGSAILSSGREDIICKMRTKNIEKNEKKLSQRSLTKTNNKRKKKYLGY